MTDTLIEHIKKAEEIANNTSGDFRLIAFEVVLSHLLANSSNRILESTPREILSVKKHDKITSLLNSNFDWSQFNIEKLKPTPQLLLILKIAKNEFGLNELTPSEIQKILEAKFRMHKSVNALSMLLMEKVGKYVDRILEGNKFYYRITGNGEKFVEDELNETK